MRAEQGAEELTAEEPDAGTTEMIADGSVVVQELDGQDGLTHRARTNAHTLLVDEPPAVGGADLGPSPYDELLAGLGACASMTMRMYARRKGWDVAPAQVRLWHERIHADDCAACETGTGMLDRINREITLDPDLRAEQREALGRIADKCPVHRTLTNEVEIATTVVSGRSADGGGIRIEHSGWVAGRGRCRTARSRPCCRSWPVRRRGWW